MTPLNLFYAEPDGDRWLPLDRYPRRLVRRLVRGKRRPGGQEMVFLNLMAGLDRLGLDYRVNDYRHARRHPEELCCVLGKRHVLAGEPWRNPLLAGPCIFDHPVDEPALFQQYRIRRLLVPGPWMRDMCRPLWGEAVHAWPVGIDTDRWTPAAGAAKSVDFILYNKIRWDHARQEEVLLAPLRAELQRRGLSFVEMRYGSYQPDDYRANLARARAMIFICEHETQGLAYQQALAAGIPLLAWEHGGEWRDPNYHPHRVRYGPVSAVPYWDARCGVKFADAREFPAALENFRAGLDAGRFAPRDYILENLTLARAAAAFVEHARAAATGPDCKAP